MKTKEISVGLSGVISTASWENLRPSFNIVAELEEGETDEECFAKLRGTLRAQFEMEANRAKTDLIEKQYSNIRFREKDGKKFPSVTSILDWDKTWRVTQDELNQYAARGTIVHKLIEIYYKTGEWKIPVEIDELKEEVAILLGGSLGFSWTDCTHELFIEKYGDKIKVEKTEQIVFNDEILYSGQYDLKGSYDNVSAIIDFKTGAYDMRQLAAYAVCETGIKRLVVLPVGPTDNKCGYKKPVICDTINDQFKDFLKARKKFRLRFGI
jgi:hypothetical protein